MSIRSRVFPLALASILATTPFVYGQAGAAPAAQPATRVLAAKHYAYQFVFARNAGHVERSAREQTLPEALEYVWQGYKAK